jgi:hypothetical protein
MNGTENGSQGFAGSLTKQDSEAQERPSDGTTCARVDRDYTPWNPTRALAEVIRSESLPGKA